MTTTLLLLLLLLLQIQFRRLEKGRKEGRKAKQNSANIHFSEHTHTKRRQTDSSSFIFLFIIWEQVRIAGGKPWVSVTKLDDVISAAATAVVDVTGRLLLLSSPDRIGSNELPSH